MCRTIFARSKLSIYSTKLRRSLAIAEYLERGKQADLLSEEKALVLVTLPKPGRERHVVCRQQHHNQRQFVQQSKRACRKRLLHWRWKRLYDEALNKNGGNTSVGNYASPAGSKTIPTRGAASLTNEPT